MQIYLQIYATVLEQISGWQILTEFWHNITFIRRRRGLLGRIIINITFTKKEEDY